MKKVLAVTCFVAGYSYGMSVPVEANIVEVSATSGAGRTVSRVTDRSVSETDVGIFEATESIHQEGRLEAIVRKNFTSILIATIVSPWLLLAASKLAKDEKIAAGLKYSSFGSMIISVALQFLLLWYDLFYPCCFGEYTARTREINV